MIIANPRLQHGRERHGAQEIFPAWSGSPDLVYMKITNISILASAVVWLSRTGNAAVGMPGSYALNLVTVKCSNFRNAFLRIA